MSERFAVGAVAEVVVAAGARGFGDDLDFAGLACEREHGLSLRVELVELEWLSVDAPRVQALERLPEPAEVFRPR